MWERKIPSKGKGKTRAGGRDRGVRKWIDDGFDILVGGSGIDTLEFAADERTVPRAEDED